MRGSKILVISYYFTPQLHTGAFRNMQFLRHFRDNGLNAVILTNALTTTPTKILQAPERYAEFPVFRISTTPVYSLWKLLLRAFKKLLNTKDFINESYHATDINPEWLQTAYKKAIELIKEYHCDTIYIAAPPFGTLLLGYWLKKATGCHLIIDLQEEHTDSTPLQAQLEHRCLTECDALIVNSWSYWTHYSQKLNKEKVFLIFDGYDDIFRLSNESSQHIVFTLFYMGTWDALRSPQKLLASLQRCQFPWRLISVGSTNHILNEQALRYHVHEHLTCVPSLAREELLPYLQQAHLLFITRELPNGAQWDKQISNKIFNYLATGKPILAQVPLGDTYDFLQKYARQTALILPDEIDGLYNSLQSYYHYWQAGNLHKDNNPDFLQLFDGKTITRKLSTVFQMLQQG
ncbi:hypothetical protein [Beggiatoa leptomitoformis]|uniref:Glycosyltransferase n=1 Tax=Beggiatoa leptomitoformis TaxID=288004 RepID=A0A2N9YBU0_9GAMM|nr:hypothetical protein [Beggiatoa leptomitoformis]ALG66740.1 hypothetical protein AL038_02185 [Beggiatoa leptomitoformis]AUI67921.1 hypothetical protein BLE401_03855 [Beggiatoa leptomitoformis]